MVIKDSNFINLNWIKNIIGIHIDTNNKKLENNNIFKCADFKFGTFNRPSLDSNTLYIILDHSFEYLEYDNVIFIDHHLIGELFDINYCSNSELMFKNYELIYHTVKELFSQFSFSSICVFMHHDIDGVCSGIIMKKILLDIGDNIFDKDYDKKIKLAQIFGNFGDISPTAAVDLSCIFDKETSIEIYSKKISLFCRHFSRFMKATRFLFSDFNEDYVLDSYNIKIYNSYIKSYNIDVTDIYDVIQNICNDLKMMESVNTKSILYYFNSIAINKFVSIVVEAFVLECDKFISMCINPDKTEPSFFETLVQFKFDNNQTKFRFLVVDTPFDCGRTIIWKYKYQFNKIFDDYKIGKIKSNKYYYKIVDWKNINNKVVDFSSTESIMCYNKFLNKLSLDSSNSSAFDIAKYFGGGGHESTDDGRSIGSVVVDNVNDVLSQAIITEIF